MAISALDRARGCMTAAGLFFQKGAEDISQAIELGLRTDDTPENIYETCMGRDSADKNVLAMTSLIIFFMVRDDLNVKKAVLSAWRIADKYDDPIIKELADALMAAGKSKSRGKYLAQLLMSKDLRENLELAIYINTVKMEDSFAAHLSEIKKLEQTNAKIIAAGFSGAFYGLKEVNAAQK